ncbi:outer membrane protein assembly factor BamD [Sphingomonas sp.]|uniref:outer membrane protein assembly factor BamD n=1 Tax=Sphingomonas sp. TaxID=28214 RepID=UPI0025E1EAFD|nr:outer membrane protein assembly factor BamD [Sphingomonas sp.]MBV9529198.1 outer membrane protein assembly factor BamD [Sphingomonas sp.]
MPKLTRSVALLVGCALVLPLAACAHGGKHGGDTAYVARDVNTLYAAAKGMMDKGDYLMAAKLFDEVERQHPYSVWARRAQVMSAFNYYLAEKYSDSISSAQRFLTIHPGNSEAPYAHYLVAMSYYQQIEDVNRDQATTAQALNAFNELIRLYPDTRYASDARLKLDLIQDHLAGKEMEVGRFYERSGEWLAASLRFRKVVDQYQTTSHAPEALERLVECYLALGIPDEADKAAAVLGRNYNGTYWYKQAYMLIARKTPRGARQAIAPTPVQTPAQAPTPAAMPAPPQS